MPSKKDMWLPEEETCCDYCVCGCAPMAQNKRLRAAGDKLLAWFTVRSIEGGVFCGACDSKWVSSTETLEHEINCVVVAWEAAKKGGP